MDTLVLTDPLRLSDDSELRELNKIPLPGLQQHRQPEDQQD